MKTTITSSASANSTKHHPDFIRMVSLVSKAPSGHNTQPWLFRIRESAIEIHPDFRYCLPEVDGNNRELYISLGCAAENLIIAASELGYGSDFSILKTNGVTHMRIDLAKGNREKDLLFAQIEKRQSNKSVYQYRQIPADTIDNLNILVRESMVGIRYFEKGTSEFQILRELVALGNTIQMTDDGFRNELINWMRFNKGEVAQ